MKIKEIDFEKDDSPPVVWRGIKIEKLDFVDKHLEVIGDFFKILGFEIPENLFLLPANFKYEYVFDDETPQKCISIEIVDCSDWRRNYSLRGVFSVKLEHWFQHVRYEVMNDKTTHFRLRTTDHDDKDRNCDPYAVMSLLDLYDFNKRFKEVMEKCSLFVEKNKEKIINISH